MGRFSKLERTDGTGEPEPVAKPGVPPGSKGPPLESFDYPTALQRAEDHFYKGEYEKALRFYSRALQTENSQPAPWIGQLICLVQMKQIKEADLWLQRGLELFPEDASLLSLRAVVLARKGMTKRGIGTSDYAMTRGGSTPLPWIARGEVLTLAESKNAGFCFEKAMEAAAADDWKTPFLIGLFHFDQGIWATALEYLQKAASRGAGTYWLWYLLGVCYARLSFKQEAVDALRQSLALNAGYPPAQEMLRKVTHRPLLGRLFGGFGRKRG
jgi:tetratricopeptide (TPR) repeat protein